MYLVGWGVFIAELAAILWLVRLYATGAVVITFEKGADLATLVLTASALVVTGVGVAVAVVTVWGMKEIREHAVKAAVREALKAVAKNTRGAYDAGGEPAADADANKIAESSDD